MKKGYNFIQFDGVVPRGDTKIAINKSGLIRLSAGFCRVTGVKSFQYAILFYDAMNYALAIKFIKSSNKKPDGIFTLTNDKAAATISGKSFFKANTMDLKKISGRYEWKKMFIENIGEVYIIDLIKK